jgi:hypothetical protein
MSWRSARERERDSERENVKVRERGTERSPRKTDKAKEARDREKE